MVSIPREICSDVNQALTREWIVTNGLGGFASSTILGANTRRYHGLLVAALKPPTARTVTLAKVDEEIEVRGVTYRLGTNEYERGAFNPDGYVFLHKVELDGMIPTFFYQAANFSLTKRIWMPHGHNTTYIHYTLESAPESVRLTLLPFCTFRDFHIHTRGDLAWHFGVEPRDGQVAIKATPAAAPYHLLTFPASNFTPLDLWYWRFRHRVEDERGLDSIEDLNVPGQWHFRLPPGGSVTLVVTTEDPATVDRDVETVLQLERTRQTFLARDARDEFEKQIYLAADQFIVERTVDDAKLSTIIAGYPWFGDWGRDTMIAFEGLTLTTGRFAEARDILRAFARYVNQGMLPNRFPDAGLGVAPIEYNTVDATLWYFHALERYFAVTKDHALLRELFPLLQSIVDWHVRGTRYHIHVDPSDGLLAAGEPGVQLTWMDAKADDWVVTPRIGKPVEINALWYAALRSMENWAAFLEQPDARYAEMADRVRAAFDRFWFAEGKYLYDVIDTPHGNDASLRPNQLFAISLAEDLVPPDRAQAVLEIVTRNLLTPFGLRSLSPHDPQYHPLYRGNQSTRDAAYHQGLVWAWLIGAYADARCKVYGDREQVRALIYNFRQQLTEAGLGTLGEIFEADPPYRPVGCIAQAWSVAEVLRILDQTRD